MNGVNRGIVFLFCLILLAAFPYGNAQAAASPAEKELEKRTDFQSRALLSAIDAILKDAAAQREAAKQLPSEKRYVFPPIWRETREDREVSVRKLLDGALEIITDAPILQMQAKLKDHRNAIADLRSRISELREKRIEAPPTGFLPGWVMETQSSIDTAVAGLEQRIASHETGVVTLKNDIGRSIRNAGIDLADNQVDLLLDSVLGGDLLKLVTAFEVARIVDQRLSGLLSQTQEDLQAARRYFAMHAALFALLIHAQELLLEKIDTVYLTRLDAILADVALARHETKQLLSRQNRDDQRRALTANQKSQDSAEKVAIFYRDYLQSQRKLLAEARERTLHDLAIADNTYDTVEASFQLRTLMDEARTSFEALQRLEAPGFDQIFKNDDLKREFENLTQRLAPGS